MASRSTVQDEIIPRLLSAQLVTAAQVERARGMTTTDRAFPSVAYQLVKIGAITAKAMVEELAAYFKVKGMTLTPTSQESAAESLLDWDMVLEKRVVPLRVRGATVEVAMVDPRDFDTLEFLAFKLKREIVPVVVDEASLDMLIERKYAEPPVNMDELITKLDGDMIQVEDDQSTDAGDEQDNAVNDAPVVRLVNQALTQAVQQGASDIHFECYESYTRIRIRQDGHLREIARLPRKHAAAMVSRLKVMARLDTAQRRLPQDGRARRKFGNRFIDFRVSTMPATHGESVVLRILDKSAVSLDIDALGITGRSREVILRTSENPNGMLLVTGPTGSGKTTTLYALINRLNNPETNLLTVEDPVEYDFPGVRQVAVNPDTGYTFAKALKAMLRQDPEVIMVGEIRDQETAQMAIRAALTGHLVLSTLHTNDSASTITRLVEMGMESFNIAASLSAVVAQRLVRRTCLECIEEYTPTEADLQRANLTPAECAGVTFTRGRGKDCGNCNGTGYRGRAAVYEVLKVTPTIQRLISSGASSDDIRKQAVTEGTQLLRDAALEMVASHITTLAELVKITSA